MIFSCLIFLTLTKYSMQCMATKPGDGEIPCLSCTESLIPAVCPFEGGCSDCLTTKITFDTSSRCKKASIACGPTGGMTYIGLTRKNENPIEVLYDQLGVIECTATGWQYTATDGTNSIINGVSCYHYPTSTQQSPIDIMNKDVVYDPELLPEMLNFNYVVGDAHDMHIASDTHGFTVYMQDNVQSTLTATHLPATYRIYNVHAHWNDGSKVLGSEHLLNGMKYAGEIHLVHWNPIYGTFRNAVGKPDGLAVLGVFFSIGAESAEFLKITDAITAHIPVTVGNDEVDKSELNDIDFKKMLPVDRNYFTYIGSLTTPDYNTCVIWTVFKTPITINQAQKDVLLSLFDMKNAREAQEVLSEIRSSFQP